MRLLKRVAGRLVCGLVSLASGAGGTILTKWYFDNYLFKTYAELTPFVKEIADYAIGGAILLFIIAIIAGFIAIFGDN